MNEKVLIAGTFDPITRGHLDLIERAAAEYPRVSVGVFVNPEKTCLLPLSLRLRLIELAVAPLAGTDVVVSDGYTADFAKAHGYTLLLRGYRDERDLAYENEIAAFNLARAGIPTRLVRADPALTSVSSTRVREAVAAKDRKALAALVPPACLEELLAYLKL